MNTKTKILLITAVFLILVLAKQAQAIFIVEKSVKNNIIRTGEINFVLSPEEAWLTSENLVPGQTISNEFTLKNTGSAPLVATISAKKSAGYKNLFDTLIISIKDNEQLIYEGPASEMLEAQLFSDPLAVDVEKKFSIQAHLPTDVNSTVDNTYSNLTFVVESKQAA